MLSGANIGKTATDHDIGNGAPPFHSAIIHMTSPARLRLPALSFKDASGDDSPGSRRNSQSKPQKFQGY